MLVESRIFCLHPYFTSKNKIFCPDLRQKDYNHFLHQISNMLSPDFSTKNLFRHAFEKNATPLNVIGFSFQSTEGTFSEQGGHYSTVGTNTQVDCVCVAKFPLI